MLKSLKGFLLSLGFLALAPASVFATSTVQYEGGAENFVFYTANNTDLFSDFKSMMPGDTRATDITVKNIASEYDYVKIFLRAESSTSSDSLLSRLTLNLYRDGELISTSPASDPGSLLENYELGTFYPGDETLLTVELSAPLTLGNNFQDADEEIRWLFSAEAYKDGKMVVPNTGSMPTANTASATPIIMITVLPITIVLAAINRRKLSRLFETIKSRNQQ